MPESIQRFLIKDDIAPTRLDVYLSGLTGQTRSHIAQWITNGQICVDGKVIQKTSYKVSAGQQIDVSVPASTPVEIIAENIPIDIIYQDEDIAVINKAQGMVVHPAPGHESGTLVNALLYHCRDLSGINGEIRPGIVHRIDKDTSGLLVIAKNDQAHTSLAGQIATKTAMRTYWALVSGNIKEDEMTIDAPVGRHKTDRKKMAVIEGGRPAITHIRVLERFGNQTLIEARLETGRTHQIRVHLKHIGHPVLGDPVYATKPYPGLNGQALHAIELQLQHPKTGETLVFNAPLPDWFERVLQKLRSTIS